MQRRSFQPEQSPRRSFSSQVPRQPGGIQEGREQRSFFRGPDAGQVETRGRTETFREFERQSRQGPRQRDFQSDVRSEREASETFRGRRAESDGERGRSWREEVFGDNRRAGDLSRDEGNPNRFDRDRTEPDQSDRDRPEREQAEREQRERDRSDRDRPGQEQANREQVERDRSDQDDFRRDRTDNWWNDSRGYRGDDWRRTAERIRRDWRRRDRQDLPFRFGWWANHRLDRWPVYSPWRHSWWRGRPYYWWGWTPALRLTDWLVFGWDRPYYWEYGPGGNIYYRNNYVYYDDRQYLPVDDYYQQVHNLAHSVPAIDDSDVERMDWTPLGVFAAIRDDEDEPVTIQLAVNRSGVLSGTYYNPLNGHVHPLQGMVDERTQRAAWAFSDGEHPDVVFETSIYNLTKSETSMMVHFGPQADDAEVWRLVRLESPAGTSEELPLSEPVERSTRRSLP